MAYFKFEIDIRELNCSLSDGEELEFRLSRPVPIMVCFQTRNEQKTDVPIDYSFSADAGTVMNGIPYSITGNFGYDPLTGYEFGGPLDIDLNGHSPYGAQCFFDAEPAPSLNAIIYTCPAYLTLEFANDLSNVPDPLQEVFGAAVPHQEPATGFACPGPCPIKTPEPTSLAILGTALGLFFGRRAIRRPGQAQKGRSNLTGCEALSWP